MKACKLHTSLKEKKIQFKAMDYSAKEAFSSYSLVRGPYWIIEGGILTFTLREKKWRRERERNFYLYNFISKKVYILHQFGYFPNYTFSVLIPKSPSSNLKFVLRVERLIRPYVICKSLWILASKIFLEYLTTTRSNFLRSTDSADIFKAFGWV